VYVSDRLYGRNMQLVPYWLRLEWNRVLARRWPNMYIEQSVRLEQLFRWRDKDLQSLTEGPALSDLRFPCE
jgi:hypothetical protein